MNAAADAETVTAPDAAADVPDATEAPPVIRRIAAPPDSRGASAIRVAIAALAAFILGAAAGLARAEPVSGGVRFGSHPTYERAVFDWNETVEYRVETDGRRVALVFARPARLDAQRLAAGLGAVAADLAIAEENAGTTLRFTLADGVELKHFRNETNVVLDFRRDGAATPPAAAPPAAPKRVEAERPAPATEKPATAEKPVAAEKQAAADKPARAPTRLVPPAVAPAAGPAQASAAAPSAPAASAPSAQAPAATAAPAAPTPAVAPSSSTAPGIGPLPARAGDLAGLTGVPVEVSATAAGWRLRFAWREPVGAAVFARGPTLWIVFDRRAVLGGGQLAQRRADLGPADIALIDGANPGAVLRLTPVAGTRAIAARDGDTWIVELGERVAAPQAADVVARAVEGERPRLSIMLPGARSLMRLRDPEIGDELLVLPTQTPGIGVTDARAYAPFRVLPSVQGAVIQPLSERVVARPTGESVEISDPQLAFTDPSAVTVATVPLAMRRQPLFDISAWRKRGPARYTEDLQALHRAAASAKPAERAAGRLALARFHFANLQPHDAAMLLRVIGEDDANLAAEPANRGLRGAAALMAGDLDEAERSLGHPSLAASAEASLWRGLLKLAQGEGARALDSLTQGLDMAERYPQPFRARVGLAHAAALIAAEEPEAAQRAIDNVATGKPGENEMRRVQLLRGQLMALKGDHNGALAVFRKLEAGPPSPERTEAVQSRVEMQLAARQLAPKDAIAELERLRFSWRGDPLEFRTLARLGRLLVAEGNLRFGLLTLRDAATQFPTDPDTGALVAEMGHVFARLYLDGEADRLPAVQAIALFEEFRELVPPGARGDEMVRKLADRLVKVDLVDRAGDLLEHQVKNRLAGAEKAEIGARLAALRLIDRKADLALAALRDSASPEATSELRRDRTRLEARAKAMLGDVKAAAQLLAGDDAQEAELLRAEIAWTARDWAAAAAALGKLAGEPPAADAKLDDARARLVLNRASALALAGDEPGLASLRERFGAAMRASPYAPLFQVVAAEPGGRPADVAQAMQQVAATAPFQSFLQTYRQKLATPPRGS